MPIIFDSTTAPVHVVRYLGWFSDEEWRRHIDGFAQILARAAPYSAIVDNSEAKETPSAAQREAMSRWLRLNAAALRMFCRGVSFVHRSPLVRGAVTAIHWVAPPPYPFSTFALRADAMEWCRKRMAE
jgi:hypothetical protein